MSHLHRERSRRRGRALTRQEDDRSRLEWHRPRFYRYLVSTQVRGFRISRNYYPGAWIGMAIVIGSYAYCVKWGWAR